MDRIVEVKVNGNFVTKDCQNAGVQGEGNVTALRIEFDESWFGMAKTITWWDAKGENPTSRVLTADLLEDITASALIYLTTIPPEPLAVWGECMFGIDGYINGKRAKSAYAKMVVKPDGSGKDAIIEEPTPDQIEQLQVQIDTLLADMQAEAIRAETAKESAVAASTEAVAAKDAAVAAQTATENVKAEFENALDTAKDTQAKAEKALEAAEDAVAKAEEATEAAQNVEANAQAAEAAAASASSSAAAAEDAEGNAKRHAASAGLHEGNALEYARDASSFASAAESSAAAAAKSAEEAKEVAGGDFVTPAELAAHNEDAEAHPTLRQAMGDMKASTYDPQGKAQDVFAYADNAVKNAAKVSSFNVTLLAVWTGSAPYTQEVTCDVLATDMPDITPVYSADNDTAILEREAWNLIGKAEAQAGKLVFTAFEEAPAQALTLQVRVVR